MSSNPEMNVLVLQGGGALGSYQAGAFEALFDSGRLTDWVSGVSIGAINAALIAGNPPEKRIARLVEFWEMVTSGGLSVPFADSFMARGFLNALSAHNTMMHGVPGFFRPRFPPATLQVQGAPGATSFYDTTPLRETLLKMVDFDYLNQDHMRISVGAVNVETGNMTWFDSAKQTIAVEHIMASGALPPGFPAVEIDGQHFWDGGLVSNTPLQYVYDERPDEDLCIFQVDLFNARGNLPASVWQIEARAKDIRFSSRTRFNTDALCGMHASRRAGQRLYDKLPAELRDDPDALALLSNDCDPHVTIAHLIYRQTRLETHAKDYEFSRKSMRDHWDAGQRDVGATLNHPDWHARHHEASHIRVFDLAKIEAG
jgi:NTE family protein